MTVENNSTDSSLKENDLESDQRRINLLNDPNYGIILCFLGKFRSVLDLPNYPLQLFEDHLVNNQENPSRLIDFHFVLLKRLSLAKNAQRDKFDSILAKFASRFDSFDSEQLTTIGYLQVDITLKLRILKNLVESQFDLNQTLKNILCEKSSRELKSLPLGRDRFGASYWFFMDNDCFVRLFREDVNDDRTWTNVVKNRDELERFIRLFITDSVVRKRFPDWTIDYEPFASLLPTNEFEHYYTPVRESIKEETMETTATEEDSPDIPVKRKRGRPKRSITMLKEEDKNETTCSNEEKADLSTTRKRGRPKRSTKALVEKIDNEVKEDEDEKFAVPLKRKPGRPRTSGKTSKSNTDTELEKVKPAPSRRGRKRKVLIDENYHNADQSQQDETSLDDMSLALRRSYSRQASVTAQVSTIATKTTPQLPETTKSHSRNTKPKVATNPRGRRRKTTTRRNFDEHFCLSTSSSDEHPDYLSEDEYHFDDDDDPSPIDIEDHFFELDEDDMTTTTHDQQLRPAKTAQTSTIVTACSICSQSDRPEVLLLCDDCNDAYHLECLRPILLSVPDGDWYCPLCEHKQFSNSLIEKFKYLLEIAETKERIRLLKKSSARKTKIKEYSSDESLTASESDINDESILSTSQINENSNLSSSCYFDDEKNNSISQRGRLRRTRFDIKKMLDEEYIDGDDENHHTDKTDFHLQLPKKITRLLHRHDRSTVKNDSQTRTSTTRLSDTSYDLNEKLGSPLVYVNGEGNARQTKSVVTNFKQTLKIVRRWNDVQRRSRLKATTMKLSNEPITSDYVDENSGFDPDDISLPYSNDSNSNSGIKDEDNALNRTKINLGQPTTLVPVDKCSSRNLVKKSEANFDRLTRDIQIAVNEAHVLPVTTIKTMKTTDQQHVKRLQKAKFSPYMSKNLLPLHLPQLSNDAGDLFKSKDSSPSTATDLSTIILTPTSSSSLLNSSDNQTISTT